jgi:hypothetical protein
MHFDTEEQCQRLNAGNWQQRLARKRSTRGPSNAVHSERHAFNKGVLTTGVDLLL